MYEGDTTLYYSGVGKALVQNLEPGVHAVEHVGFAAGGDPDNVGGL